MVKIIRPVNLIILAFTQFIIYFLFFSPLDSINSVSLNLNTANFSLLVLISISIAASGNIINDYFDYELDKASKLKYQLKNKFDYLRFYYPIVIIGFIASLYLAKSQGNIALSLIYLAVSSLLFLYSSKLKSTILIGNLLIALFTSGVILIILFAEKSTLTTLKSLAPQTYLMTINILIAFCVFAFLINISRELIKDIIDKEGDHLFSVNTFPVTFGTITSIKLVLVYLIILLVAICIWTFDINPSTKSLALIFSLVLLMVPNLFLTAKTIQAKSINDIKKLSNICKINMGLALCYLIVY